MVLSKNCNIFLSLSRGVVKPKSDIDFPRVNANKLKIGSARIYL